MCGIAAFQGAATGEKHQIVRGALIDVYTASLAVSGVIGALYQRAVTGRGQYVMTSLLAAALTMQAGRLVWADDEPREVNRELLPGRIAGIHPTKEGDIYISAHTQRFWASLRKYLGLADLASDERYDSSQKRSDRAEELVPRIRDALQRRTADEWVKLMSGQVPCSAVGTIEDMFQHAQVRDQRLVAHFDHSRLGGYSALSRPVHFSGTGPPELLPAPSLGEHTDGILVEHGLGGEEIIALRRRGVVS